MFDDNDGGSGPQVLETFKFNFAIDDDGGGDQPPTTSNDTTPLDQQVASSAPDPSSLIPGQQHDPNTLTSELLFPASRSSQSPSRLPITATFAPYKLPPLPSPASSNHQLASILRHSDVVPSVYEGGYKVWECAIDLCKHLDGLRQRQSGGINCGRVLELGCGHGLCGLWTLVEGGAQHVTFHDLNPEVITDLTLPTIALNLQLHSAPPLTEPATLAQLHQHTTFLSGDWSSSTLLTLLTSPHPATARYSLILTSDTLYHTASIPPLLRLIEQCLAADGVALIASKRYYFGVGGGTVALMALVERDSRMVSEVVEVMEDGQSNIREIVRLSWKEGRIPSGCNKVEQVSTGAEGDGDAMTDH